MGLTELLKLRCLESDCRTIRVPAGVDLSAEDVDHVVPAGRCKIIGVSLAMARDNIPTDADNGDVSLAESVWFTFIPKLLVTKVADATERPWVQGEAIFYDEATLSFTDLDTDLAACGYALEVVASTATEGLMCFQGDNVGAAAADITASS